MILRPGTDASKLAISTASAHRLAILSLAGFLLIALLPALPAAADIGDLDPTFANGAGYKAFDLGKSFKICAMDAASDGTTVLLLGTSAGSEIWTVDSAGTNATHLKTYSFAGTTSCDEGLRDVICPDGTFTCYAAGSIKTGGDADTWAVAFDRRNGNPDSSILPGGSEVVDLDPAADDGANAVCVSPATGAPEEVMPAGSDGDLGMNLDLGFGTGWTANTLTIAHQPTEVLGERIDGNYRYSWGDTKPTEGQKRYIWVCSDKKNANGDWEPDTTFANNGCIKLESNEVLRGLEVVPGPLGEPVLLTEGMDANGGKIVGGRLLERYQGTSQMRSDLDFQIDSSGNPRGSHLLCCSTDSGYPELVVEWKDDKGTHAQDLVEGSSQVQDENGFDINYVELSGDDLVLQSSSGDYPFAELLSGSGQTHSPSQAGDSPLSVGEASSLPPYETLVFVGRDDSTVDSNLVVARYQLGYPAGPCVADAHTVCIDDQPGDKRYRVTVHYATTQGGRDGQSHPGNAIALSSLGVTHGGLFWFFDAKNPEMLIKVLNGTNANQHRWVFYSAGTNVGLTTTVQDTETGAVVTYENPDRHPAAPVLDVSAFTSDGQVGSPYQQTDKSFDYAQDFVQAPEASTACATTDTSLCIDNRFEITVSYHTTQGGRDGSVQVGHAISLSSLSVDRGGLFWFFDKTNPEMLIKVLDACGLSGHYWVFYSAGTSVGLTARVVDTVNHLANTYTNDDKSQAPALLDQQAFPCN